MGRGRRTYDEEDRQLARDLYCAPEYKSMVKLIERMRAQFPERYGSLQEATISAWKKKDKGGKLDWDKVRDERRLRRFQRTEELADIQAEDILDKLLKDLLLVRDQLSKQIKKKGERAAPVEKLASIVFAYNKTADKALEILRGKIKEVDLTRLTPQSQSFFIRRVLEDLVSYAREVDLVLADLLGRHLNSILARMRGQYADRVITDVSKDLCIETILKRFGELNGRDSCKTTAHEPGAAGVAR